jgi:hypothetical protein
LRLASFSAVVAAWIAPACDQWFVEIGRQIGLS